MKLFICTIALIALAMPGCTDAAPPDIEAGTVKWGRDPDAALASSKKSGRPVFALFQEIPGCAGSRQFGKDVLSHPLVVEAIETEFTPLLIHNNKPGKDAEVLRRFGEPAWNYLVVRFLDAEGKDILPRRDKVWDVGRIVERMIGTLQKSGRPIPAYLGLLSAEHSPRLQEADFSMSCFWSGEVALGQIEGVVNTEAGFMDGHEVVRVRFDPEVISTEKLIAFAKNADCQHVHGMSKFRSAPAGDQKRQLRGTALAKLALSAAQATKTNAWIGVNESKTLEFLTPSQKSGLN